MKSGFEMRKVINQLNGFDFNNSADRHIFGTVYESILIEFARRRQQGRILHAARHNPAYDSDDRAQTRGKILDPAVGTGGFLTAAIDYIRENEVRTLDDEAILQQSITGWELKPVAYVLGLTNLILHGLDVPDWHYLDSSRPNITPLAPSSRWMSSSPSPFGASIADGVETNFPQSFRCRESADLFVILMIQLLKPGGRCAIVLPDGCITGDGYKERIRDKLLTDCNLHTIVRLPQSTFHPATVSTNLLFFQKGTPTKEIWYYEHRLSEGRKVTPRPSRSGLTSSRPMIAWWDNRQENEVAWRMKVEDLKEGFDLDVKNPNSVVEEKDLSVVECLTEFRKSMEADQRRAHRSGEEYLS